MDIKVLDTNVLLHSPTALDSFTGHNIVIPLAVIRELDAQKKRQDEAGKNARVAIRRLDKLQEKFGNEMVLENGSKVAILSNLPNIKGYNLEMTSVDDQIISYALRLRDSGEDVTFVSNDGAARVKARSLGLKVQGLEEDRIDVKLDDIYPGWTELMVSPDRIEEFYAEKTLKTRKKLYTNQFVLLKNEQNLKQTALAKFDGKQLVPLRNGKARAWDISAVNMQQQFLMEALLDPKIKLVTTMGTSGTGKSLLSLAAAGHQAVECNLYRKMVVYKPVIPMGRDIGYLPGTEEEKLRPWMANIYDSLEYIFGTQDEKCDEFDQIRYLIEKGHIELSALTYIRGRSLPNLIIILDEAQNTSPNEIKTLISRAGEGTKIILTGDVHQVDNPYLDSQNNGLVYTIEKFKGQDLFAHVTLHKPERSELSALAAELL